MEDAENGKAPIKRGRTPKLDKKWLSDWSVASNQNLASANHFNQKWTLESDYLRSKVSVHCMIMSKGKKKSKAVKATWGRHCNSVTFHGSYYDNAIPVIRYSSLEPSSVSFCKSLINVLKLTREKTSLDEASEVDQKDVRSGSKDVRSGSKDVSKWSQKMSKLGTPTKIDGGKVKKVPSFDYLLIAEDTAYVLVENARKTTCSLGR